MNGPSTQHLSLIAGGHDLQALRERLNRAAAICEVRIDAIDERKRLGSTRLDITVTGDAHGIEAFREATGGSVWKGDGTSLLSFPVSIGLEAMWKFFKRKRERPGDPRDP